MERERARLGTFVLNTMGPFWWHVGTVPVLRIQRAWSVSVLIGMGPQPVPTLANF